MQQFVFCENPHVIHRLFQVRALIFFTDQHPNQGFPSRESSSSDVLSPCNSERISPHDVSPSTIFLGFLPETIDIVF